MSNAEIEDMLRDQVARKYMDADGRSRAIAAAHALAVFEQSVAIGELAEAVRSLGDTGNASESGALYVGNALRGIADAIESVAGDDE